MTLSTGIGAVYREALHSHAAAVQMSEHGGAEIRAADVDDPNLAHLALGALGVFVLSNFHRIQWVQDAYRGMTLRHRQASWSLILLPISLSLAEYPMLILFPLSF